MVCGTTRSTHLRACGCTSTLRGTQGGDDNQPNEFQQMEQTRRKDGAEMRLGLLPELVLKAATVGVLLDPSLPDFETELKDTEEAGRAIWSHALIMKAALQSTSRHRKKNGQA